MQTPRLKMWSIIWTLCFLGATAFGAEPAFSWQNADSYNPPDFEKTFPLDPEASKRLEQALSTLESSPPLDGRAPFDLMRLGLRGLRVDRQMQAVRWFGNAYIWNKSPQDPEAIELMYHAAGSANSEISYNAIYFGLSVVRPMTEPVLHALADVAMNSRDPNLFSRIAWGAAAQKSELLSHLQPHVQSDDPARRKHAEELRQIFSGEVKAFPLAEQKAKKAAAEKYSGRLEEIRAALVEGDSKTRREILELIQRDRISLIMDPTFVGAFSIAAEDADPKVRKAVAIIAGSTWIWKSGPETTNAIPLMMRLARDLDGQVRYNAMYYGLSTIRNRTDDVVDRMIEMTMRDGLDDKDFRGRIISGLRGDEAATRRVLEKWMREPGACKPLFAYGCYLDFFKQPPTNALPAELLQTPDKVVAQILAFGPASNWKPRSIEEFSSALRQEVGAIPIWDGHDGLPFSMIDEAGVPSVKQTLTSAPRIKIAFERPLTVSNLIHIGKEGGLKSLPRK